LTSEELRAVFGKIRWSLLTHEELVKCSQMEELAAAKNLIFDGLSRRLGSLEAQNIG